MNQAGAEGFRFVPQTLLAKRVFIGAELVALLERSPRTETRYEYKLLATNLTSTLEKEIVVAQSLGYDLVGMVSRGEHIVIMERKAQSTR